MKKIVVIFLAAVLLVAVLAVPVMAAASCYLTGPDVIRAGDTITLTFYAAGDVYGGNGTVVYDSSQLTLLGYTPLLDSNWTVEFSNNNFQFDQNSVSTPLGGSTPVFSAAFQVNSNLAPGTTVKVFVNDVVFTDGESDAGMGSRNWAKVVAEPLSGNANLASLTVSNATISPAFNPGTTEYTASVPFETSNLQVAATAEHPGAKVTVGNTWLAENGTTVVAITVTAENGAQKVYHIRTWRPRNPNYVESNVNTLNSLEVKNFFISPAFTPERQA